MPVSDVNGVELYWERAGSGARLLFCNGSGATLDRARPLIDLLAAEFDLLAWDYRGLGRSGPLTSTYGMADIAADAIGLLDLAGWDTGRVLGPSFGGMVAQELTVTNHERVERLALACTSAGGAGGSSYPLETLQELPGEERVATGLKVADDRWDDHWFDAHPEDRGLAERLIAAPDEHDEAGRRAQLEARASHDVWERLDAISCPTLVAYGRHDGIAPEANSKAIASRIRGAELRGYEGGHLFLFQDAAAFPELVTFLQAPTN
jgi:3-oxoadipate enol-lactonase